MNRIRELREARDMQQKALAIELKVSQPTVSDWESDRKQPSSKSAARIADFFGVSIDYLLGREIPKIKKDPKGESLEDKYMDEMIKIVDRLPKEGRAKAVQILNTIFPEHAESEEPEEV